MKTQTLMISVANVDNFIQAQCPYGRQHNLLCHQSLHSSELWGVMEENKIRPVLLPILKCVFHTTNNISKIYGWKNNENKFIKGNNDIIINFYPMWTLIPWQTNIRNSTGWMKQRYHFSDLALEAFIDNFVLESLIYFYLYPICIYMCKCNTIQCIVM